MVSKKKDIQKPTDINAVLETLPKEKKEVIESVIFAMEQRAFSGPLPPPEDFAGYEEVVKGSANRILNMAENNADHRMKMEKDILNRDFKLKRTGYYAGAFLVTLFGVFSFILGLNGHEELAGKIGVTTVVAVAVIFVLNKLPFFNKSENLPEQIN